MNFGKALEAMQEGKRVSRSGWNGAGMWLEHMPAKGVDLAFIRLSYPVHSKAYPNGARVPWAPSQTDMLADDWAVFGEKVEPAPESKTCAHKLKPYSDYHDGHECELCGVVVGGHR